MFSYMIFYVDSVADTLSFYEKAFGLKTKFMHDSGQYGELDTGATSIAFASHALGKQNLPDGYVAHNPDSKPLGNEIVFVVQDVQKAYDTACAAGAVNVVQPKQKPWGQIVTYVRDLNGILIELASPMQ